MVVSRQLRAAGDVKELDTALERARTLMTLEEGNARPVAAMKEKLGKESQAQELARQIPVELLTEQVAALSLRVETSEESGVFIADNRDTLNDSAGKEKENVFHVADWGTWLEIVVSRETTTGRP